jgi:hypothetical protein
MKHRSLQSSFLGAAAVGAALLTAALAAQPPSQAVVGDAARGRPLFSDTFNC